MKGENINLLLGKFCASIGKGYNLSASDNFKCINYNKLVPGNRYAGTVYELWWNITSDFYVLYRNIIKYFTVWKE